MTDTQLSPFTRQRIARLAEQTLRRADVVGTFPTPITAVQEAVGAPSASRCRELPEALAAKKPNFMSRVLGAYWHDERIVFIDPEQPEHRLFWTDAHEGTHAMCPWHAEILRLDDENTLFKQLRAGVEAEANYGAGHLISKEAASTAEHLKTKCRYVHRLSCQASTALHATPLSTTTSRNTLTSLRCLSLDAFSTKTARSRLAQYRVGSLSSPLWSPQGSPPGRQALIYRR